MFKITFRIGNRPNKFNGYVFETCGIVNESTSELFIKILMDFPELLEVINHHGIETEIKTVFDEFLGFERILEN